MRCLHCDLYISATNAQICPRCGQPLPGSMGSTLGTLARPARKSKKRGKFLSAAVIILIIIAAGAVYGYFVFLAPGHQANGSTSIPGTNTILFSDPLTSDINNWSSDSSHCFFRDNAYHVKNNIVCYSSAGSIGDASISVQAKQVAGSPLLPYGLVFRRVGRGNWYEFDIDSNGSWDFVKVVNNNTSMVIDSTPNKAIKSGLNTINTLLVQTKGSHLVFFVNGTQVGQANDPTFSSGETGLAVLGAGTEVAFNNFKITAIS